MDNQAAFLNTQRRSPTMWIERLVILKSLEPVIVVRDITLKKGLNVIWGMEMPSASADISPYMLSGHSVGKSSFCRLIKYCLGEYHFGPDIQQNAINTIFSNGYVCAKIHIEEKIWTVCRPLGKGRKHRAEIHYDFDSVLTGVLPNNSCDAFNNAVKDVTIAKLPKSFLPETTIEYSWVDFLTWLARDQGARFRALYEWRSPRSETPGKKLKKNQALYLMRLVLGLIHEKEVHLRNDIDKENKISEELNKKIENLRLEPTRKKDFFETQIALETGVFANRFDEQETSTLSYEKAVNNALLEVQDRTLELSKQIVSFDNDIILLQASNDGFLNEINRMRIGLKAIAEQELLAGEDRSDRIKKFEKESQGPCTFGGIDYSDCKYLLKNLQELRQKQLTWERSTQKLFIDLDKAGQINFICESNADLNNRYTIYKKIELEKDALKKQKIEFEKEATILNRIIGTARNYLNEWINYRDILSGKSENTELKSLQDDITNSANSVIEKNKVLKGFLNDYKSKLETLTSIYDYLIKRVLSKNFTGTVSLPAGELCFGIKGDAGYHGEAIETLSIVIADIAAMVSSCQVGYHPGFLLHDSPREADLDQHIYNNFFNAILSLVNDFGGPDTVPFQYIITTTSAPPKEVLNADVIRAKLCGQPHSEMLFGCSLRVAEAEQIDLFPNNN